MTLPEPEMNASFLFHLTPLIGRERETATANALLQRPDVRQLTITGTGGVGKTRLALQVAADLENIFPDGVRRVALAPITTPTMVIPTIAQTLGLVEVEETPLFERVKSYLHDKKLLLLLDNFEQVIAAAPLLTELLAGCPALKVLVTSREVLHTRIEHEFVLSPLALPDLQQRGDPATLSQNASVALFVERSRAVNPDFQITEGNALIIAEICTRVDGLPLAIELAAARTKILPLSKLLTRLEKRLQVLTNGARDLPRRQQTLRETLTWSYDLLDEQEQKLFRHLSIFVGGCTLEAVEYLCRVADDTTSDVLTHVASLVDKNLLQMIERGNEEARFIMLETIREYGQERLSTCGEAEVTRNAHARYYLALAEEAEPELRKAQQVLWLDRLKQEHDNLRAALQWFMEQKNFEEALRLGSVLWRFWLIRDHQGEGYQWLERALASSDQSQVAPAIIARACYAAGMLADSRGFYQRGAELWEKGLQIYRALHDQRGVATSLNKLGRSRARNAPLEAHALQEESLAIAREQGDDYGIADALASLAKEADFISDPGKGRELCEESLTISRRLGDKRSIAYRLGDLGQIMASIGNYTAAYNLLTESLSLHREIGDRVGIAFVLIPLGIVTLYMGDYSAAHTWLEESFAVSKELGNQNQIAQYLGALGEIALHQKGENATARTLLEQSLAIFREMGNEEGIASKLYELGNLEFSQGNFLLAQKLLNESLTLARRSENRVITSSALHMLGQVEAHKTNFAAARAHMEESLIVSRQIGDRWVLSSRLIQLGLVHLNDGDKEQAREFITEGVHMAQEVGDRRQITDALSVMALLYLNEEDYATAQTLLEESCASSDYNNRIYHLADLGMLAILQGDVARARPLVEESLSISMQIRNRWFIASCLERLGEIFVAQSQPNQAVRLWGAAHAIRNAISAPMPPIERAPYEHAQSIARAQLGEARFRAVWLEGQHMTPEQVLAQEGRQETTQLPKEVQTAPLSSPSPDELTDRETEVLHSVAMGLTNAQIAEHLVISPRTVQAHLSSIYSKIGVTSRSAATRYAIEHQLA
ncbi:MAG TPA: tetratricopeptide repeat protein [Ktedonosporobacter sp.]|nr:tetratricopeptide repeat protein [Ktedonosporobacter sp.]